jgi:hypothetical protein
MSDFKVGDIVKRPNGKNKFKILEIRSRNNRYGDIKIENMDTGNVYWDFSMGRGNRRVPFILTLPDLKPRHIKNLTFNFMKGI